MSPLLQCSRSIIALVLVLLGLFSNASANATSQSGFWGKLTWDTVWSGEGETRFRYGNWYGPGWWGGSEMDKQAGALPPIDALDRVAQKHDFGYEIAEKLGRGNKRLEAHYKALADVIAVRDTLASTATPDAGIRLQKIPHWPVSIVSELPWAFRTTSSDSTNSSRRYPAGSIPAIRKR